MKNIIKKILKEETENKNINSIVEMIRALFNDVVVDIEVGEIREKPFIRVQIKTDDPAVNIDNWYAQQMVDIISDYTGGEFKLMPWWSGHRRDEVFDAYIDVYRKRYDDEGNALKESRRPIKQPRAEDFEKYKDILDEIVYQFVPEDEICGYGTEYFLNAGENAVRIILYYKDDKYPGIRKHMNYAENIKHFVENYLPIVSAAFVPSDTTKCKKDINEEIKIIDQPYEDLDQYRELFDRVIYNIIGEDDICGYSLEYFLFYDEPTIRVILNYKKRNRTYEFLDKQIEKNRELASILKTFVPVVDKYIVAYDTVKCNDNINENYSPAGKEITPNKIIVHKSNPSNRNKILEQGLKVRSGECYKTYAGYGEKCIPAIFATNTTNKRAWFDSTYDDDIWYIDTTMIPDVKWFKDKHFESSKKHIVTFQDIPPDALTLFYEGSGKSVYVMKESKDDIQKNLSAIRDMLKTISWDGLCDIWVEYNKDDKEYEIRSKYVNTGADFDIYFNELEFLERTLKSMGLRPYIFAPYFVEKCEDEVEFLD